MGGSFSSVEEGSATEVLSSGILDDDSIEVVEGEVGSGSGSGSGTEVLGSSVGCVTSLVVGCVGNSVGSVLCVVSAGGGTLVAVSSLPPSVSVSPGGGC